MSLQNLCRIGQLKEHPVDDNEIRRIVDAARRSLSDAALSALSAEARFDLAYKAIMQSALAALMAKGYRPSTHKPGHHMTVLQSLSLTIGLPSERWVVLDALRRRRNQLDYTGDDVDDASAETCRNEAVQLLTDVTDFLACERRDA